MPLNAVRQVSRHSCIINSPVFIAQNIDIACFHLLFVNPEFLRFMPGQKKIFKELSKIKAAPRIFVEGSSSPPSADRRNDAPRIFVKDSSSPPATDRRNDAPRNYILKKEGNRCRPAAIPLFPKISIKPSFRSAEGGRNLFILPACGHSGFNDVESDGSVPFISL